MSSISNNYLSLNTFGNPVEQTDLITIENEEIAIFSLKDSDVLVKMAYACINPSDMFTIKGEYPGARCVREQRLPSKIGFEGAGVVFAVGKGVTSVVVGDHVVPFLGDKAGSYSQYSVVNKDDLIKVPKEIPLEFAAQVLVNPCTIVAMLDDLNISPGDFILQSAANSTLGRMLIQVCRMRGIKTINVVRREALVDELKSLGADHVVVSDAKGGNIKDQIKRISSKIKFAVDAVGGKTAAEMIESLSYGGTILLYGLQSGEMTKFNSSTVLFNEVTIKGFWLSSWFMTKPVEVKRKTFAKVLELMMNGSLNPPVEKYFTLPEFKEAFKEQLQNEKGRKGKLMFKL